MILDFLPDNMDGDMWETLCDQCYRNRYQEDGYQKIPATDRGDGGIEGYTQSGIVYQCYCPEREYSDKELYEHLRDKMTRDINKLVNQKYAKRLNELGVPTIKQWHFVIPDYKDSKILQHAKEKKDFVLEKKKSEPAQYEYISSEFKIIVRVARDFTPELSRIIRNQQLDVKLNLAVKNIGDINWEECDSDKVKNVRRKVKAVMANVSEEDALYKDIVKKYIEFYMRGIEILIKLRSSFPEVYEDIHELEMAYKNDVEIETKMNMDRKINAQLFNRILKEFGEKLSEEFKCLSFASISELKQDMVASWLADCSMQFRG